MRIHKDDKVIVISGKDKGGKGKVRYTIPTKEKVVVEGMNMIKRHTKARATTRQAGIIEREAAMHVSKVMLLCSKCNRPARIGTSILEGGKKVRVCSFCHEVID